MPVGIGGLLLSSAIAGIGTWRAKKAYDRNVDPNAPVEGKIKEGENFENASIKKDIDGDPDGGSLLEVANEGKGYYDAQTNQTFPTQEAWTDYKDKYPHAYAWH
mgnify:CR=1 FL=1